MDIIAHLRGRKREKEMIPLGRISSGTTSMGNATARAVCPWLFAATANHTRIREILLTCTNRYLTIRSISAFPECRRKEEGRSWQRKQGFDRCPVFCSASLTRSSIFEVLAGSRLSLITGQKKKRGERRISVDDNNLQLSSAVAVLLIARQMAASCAIRVEASNRKSRDTSSMRCMLA